MEKIKLIFLDAYLAFMYFFFTYFELSLGLLENLHIMKEQRNKLEWITEPTELFFPLFEIDSHFYYSLLYCCLKPTSNQV
jgi:hypothetical protein